MSSDDCPPRHLFTDGENRASFKAPYISNYNKNNSNILCPAAYGDVHGSNDRYR